MSLRRFPYLTIGWFWFLGTLIPVIGIVQVGFQAMADRYTYIPSIGVFIILSWGIHHLLEKKQWRNAFLTFFWVISCCILTVVTSFQIRHWKNSISLFKHAVEVTDNNWMAHQNLGIAYGLEGRMDDAISHLQKAISIKPDLSDAFYNLGIALATKGNDKDAVSAYRKALEIDGNHAGANLNLGILLSRMGETAGAISHCRQALQTDPGNAKAHYCLGILLKIEKKDDEAIAHFKRALVIDPTFADAHYNLGIGLIEHNREKEGRWHIAQALDILYGANPDTINPVYARAFFKMGVDYTYQGRIQKAILFFEKAIKIDPDLKEAQNNLTLLKKMDKEHRQ